MLRIRDTSGQTAEIQEQFRFVEICDLRGDVAILLYRDDAGTIKMVRAGDPEAVRYAQMFGARFVPVIPLKGPK
jgi:hypothetical protein